jgi:hypothetical protein
MVKTSHNPEVEGLGAPGLWTKFIDFSTNLIDKWLNLRALERNACCQSIIVFFQSAFFNIVRGIWAKFNDSSTIF